MLCTLMHKKIPVIQMTIDDGTSSIISIGHIYDISHLPIGIGISDGKPDRRDLNHWWLSRSIPASRSGIREALELLQVPHTQLLLTKCFGLSLSDQYWINPNDHPLEWEKINFFENPFSEDVGNALFGIIPEETEIDLLSPDNTSDGWLKKKWYVINGKHCLMKGGSNPYQQEPLNEEIASHIMKRLHIPHTYYEVIWENGLPYSICEDFVTPETDLVSAWNIMKVKKKPNHVSSYQHFINCCEELGIPNVIPGIDQMLIIDYIIANQDRHYSNFGALRNAENLEWVGLAPIFDCGTSLWFDQLVIDANYAPSKPFKKEHSEQIKLVSSFEAFNIKDLDDITEEFSKILKSSPTIDNKRRVSLCAALDKRINMLESFITSM